MKLLKQGFRILPIFLAMLIMSACSQTQTPADQEKASASSGGKKNVVVTLFPYYDFVRQVAGDSVNLKMVIPAGMDSHSFEPTPADMITIQNADILIVNGGEMEHWMSQVLAAIDTSDMTILTMMDYVDALEEEEVEGMEAEASHEPHGDGQDHGVEYDEHIWTSPVNAKKLVKIIGDTLAKTDPDNGPLYEDGVTRYVEQLEVLDEQFRKVAADAKHNTIVMGDKFPFRYLAWEYGFDYRAAFSGCSTDTEPSAKTIAYLIEKVRADQIPIVYFLELSSRRVSEIIAEETGAEPLLLHSCHNVTRREFESGVTYLELMEGNVENLRRGLDR